MSEQLKVDWKAYGAVEAKHAREFYERAKKWQSEHPGEPLPADLTGEFADHTQI